MNTVVLLKYQLKACHQLDLQGFFYFKKLSVSRFGFSQNVTNYGWVLSWTINGDLTSSQPTLPASLATEAKTNVSQIQRWLQLL